MAFHKAKEEYKWKLWKEEEENKLRELGVEESVIEQLRAYDWMCFKKERTYRTWQTVNSNIVNEALVFDDSLQMEQPVTVEAFIYAIEDKDLQMYLTKLDLLTIRIVLLKTLGYSTSEITEILGISIHVIYQRMKRLRKNLKKLIFSDKKKPF